MSLDEYMKEKLWPILVETVHAMTMYPHRKAYTRDAILQETPEITPAELAVRLKMPLGEALVISFELANERKAESWWRLAAPGTIVDYMDLGPIVTVTADAGVNVKAAVDKHSFLEMGLDRGEEVWLSFEADAVKILGSAWYELN